MRHLGLCTFFIYLFKFLIPFFASDVPLSFPLHKMLRKQEAVPVWHREKEGGVSVLLICI